MNGFRVLLAIGLALAAIDFFYHRHVLHPAEHVPGFYAMYGFVACVALVLAARGLRVWLMRREDYWDD